MDWKICKFFRKKDEPKSGTVRRKQPSSLGKIWDAMADGLGLMRHQLSRQGNRPPCSAEVYSSQTLPLDKSSFGYRTDLEVWSVDSTLRSCREPPRQADFGWPTMDEFVAIISKVIIYQLLQNSFFGMEQAEKSTKIIYQIQGCNITNVGGEIQTQNNQIANDLRKQTAHVGGEAEETASTTRGKGRGGRQRPLFKDHSTLLRERARFLDFLRSHHLCGRSLTCKRDDFFNDVTVCSLHTWREENVLAEDTPTGGSVYRFLTADCGLRSGVTEKSFSNKIKLHYKTKHYTQDTLRQVRAFFHHHHSGLPGE